MENLDQILDAGSNSFWNLLLAAVAVGASLLAARYARRAIRRKLRRYEGVDEYAGAMLGRVGGWAIVFLGVVLALTVLGVDMVPVVLIVCSLSYFWCSRPGPSSRTGWPDFCFKLALPIAPEIGSRRWTMSAMSS